jgi:uncharacterized protein YjiS (DUF1127 family)
MTSLPLPTSLSPSQPAALLYHARRRATSDWPRRYAIHTHRRILHSLPDHVLEDIGISRSEIDGIVPERLDHAGRPIGPYPF